MSTPRIGVIRVVTLDEPAEIDAHARLLAAHLPEASFTSRCIPEQFAGVHDAATFNAAVPKVVELGIELARECDALVVSCVDDPGVAELRSRLPITVVGAGEALASTVTGAAVLLNLNDDVPSPLVATGADFLQIFPAGGVGTLDLRRREVRAHYLEGMREAVEAGSTEFLAVCTGMDAEGLTTELEHQFGVNVASPLSAAAARLRAELHNTSFTHSD